VRRARAALAVAAALALGACGSGGEPDRAATGGSTLDATLRDPDGDGALAPADGEPLRLPDGGAAGEPAERLARLAQITDAHVRDEESPARVPFLDRFGAPLSSTFRPQEALTLQVLAATVDAVNAAEPDAVIQTGDLADNAQRNELVQAMTVLRGGRANPDSGAPGVDPHAPQRASNPDPFLYRPAVDAPRHPDLLAAAQRPFAAPGLDAPLHSVLGNHDVLVQGELVPDARTQALAVGDRAVVELDPALVESVDPPAPDADGEGGVGPISVDTVAQVLGTGRTAAAPPDADRRQVTVDEARQITGAQAVEAFDVGPLRALALDLNRPEGGSGGRVTPEALAWLEAELERAGDRPVIVVTHQPLDTAEGGEAALAALAARPSVLAAIAGHTHRNEVRRGPGGVWLVTTASLADFPSQARMFELVRLGDGRLALDTWMVDHGAGPAGLAATARELAFLDAQGGRPSGFAGTAADRNVRLIR
jgi:3',5'-cyclic AMP phosphodiesterase CpdA